MDKSALKLLMDFINNCAFLHDDWNPQLGESDWDQYDTNPFLLGAKTCVVTSLDGFGKPYLDYLSRLGLLPKDIVIPTFQEKCLTCNLLNDKSAIETLKKIMLQQNLDLSAFYTDSSQCLDKLGKKLSTESYQPKIYPPLSVFSSVNDRLKTWELLKQNHISLPLGDICSTIDEVKSFFKFSQSHGFKTLILKQGHRNSRLVRSLADIHFLAATLKLPLLAEAVYDVLASPVAQFISWNRKIHHLFTLAQELTDWHFVGDRFPLEVNLEQKKNILNMAYKVLSVIPDYIGVIGIDFILTRENELFVVDVNPRFNSSTYPFYFLRHEVHNITQTYARYHIVDNVHLTDLSALYIQDGFKPFSRDSGKGIFLFNPVIDFEKKMLRKWSYLVVGKTLNEQKMFEQELFKLVGKALNYEIDIATRIKRK